MKPNFFSGCHPEKIQVELYPIFFMVAKAPIFSKLKIGCRLNGQLCRYCLSKKSAQFSARLIIHVQKKSLYLNSISNMIWFFKQEKCIFRKWSFWVKGVNKPFKYNKLNLLSFWIKEIQCRKYFFLSWGPYYWWQQDFPVLGSPGKVPERDRTGPRDPEGPRTKKSQD